MKLQYLFHVLFYFLFSLTAQAQIENVIVETYYISDTLDATDTTGGILETGSITYRIYIDLSPGTKLRKIYGDVYHTLIISSTEPFFNNKADGQSFGKDFSKNRLEENTVALDSWLTLGQTTRVATKTYFGVLKANDTDGSFIGGTNNDGGSAVIPNGLLANQDTLAGIPLTLSDGFDTMLTTPASWADYGIIDIASGQDSTIFGSIKSCNQFISHNAGLQNSGVIGSIPDSNQVLVAQLTTKGQISFELNVEVEEPDGAFTRIVKYVANDDTLLADEKISPFLKYPHTCGCTDPDYLEYRPGYACGDASACQTLIVFGCTDSLACNYDPNANYNISSLCCYPGYCNDRDISIVCPALNFDKHQITGFNLYPNPARDQISVQYSLGTGGEVKYIIYNYFGKKIVEKNLGMISGNMNQAVDISELPAGLYLFRFFIGDNFESELFIKD